MERVPGDFLDYITVKWSEYYFAMTKPDQFRFFLGHVQLDKIMSGLWRLIDATPNLERRKSHQRAMDEKSNWSGVTKASLEDRKRHPAMQGKSCAQFIIAPTGELREFVKEFAARLSKLRKERRATIVLTWPAVAGTDCYDVAALNPWSEN